MGGVGNFSRENRSIFYVPAALTYLALYVAGLKTEISVPEYEAVMRKHFGEFGELEYGIFCIVKQVAANKAKFVY